jgi:hypothetical protein
MLDADGARGGTREAKGAEYFTRGSVAKNELKRNQRQPHFLFFGINFQSFENLKLQHSRREAEKQRRENRRFTRARILFGSDPEGGWLVLQNLSIATPNMTSKQEMDRQ